MMKRVKLAWIFGLISLMMFITSSQTRCTTHKNLESPSKTVVDSNMNAASNTVVGESLNEPDDKKIESINPTSNLSSEPELLNRLSQHGVSVLRTDFWNDCTSDGIAHPSYVDIDPRLMQMSASIRYSARDIYLLVKGVSVRKLSWSQTKDQCKKIVALSEYSGATFSWGDEYIMNCYKGTASTGNAETWRRVGTNHHLTLAATQISSFVAP